MGRPRDQNGRFYILSKLNREEKTKSVLKRINQKSNPVKHWESEVKNNDETELPVVSTKFQGCRIIDLSYIIQQLKVDVIFVEIY